MRKERNETSAKYITCSACLPCALAATLAAVLLKGALHFVGLLPRTTVAGGAVALGVAGSGKRMCGVSRRWKSGMDEMETKITHPRTIARTHPRPRPARSVGL